MKFLRARSDPFAWRALSLVRFAFSGRGAFVTSIGILASGLTILVILSPAIQESIAQVLQELSSSTPARGEDTTAEPAFVSGGWGSWLQGVLCLLVILGCLMLTAGIQLHKSLSATDYAYFAVGNRPPTSGLVITSHHIEAVASRFRAFANVYASRVGGIRHRAERRPGFLLKILRLLLRGVVSLTWIPRPRSAPIHPSTVYHYLLSRVFGDSYMLRWAVLRLQPDLERIGAMMRLMREVHGLSLHQQRDAILFFDPAFFWFIARQYMTNSEILEGQQTLPRQARRLRSQCEGAIELARRTERFQRRLRSMTSTLPYVVRLATTNALTISCIRLARAISLVSRLALVEARDKPARRGEVLQHAFQALYHLNWQARAHIGVHLVSRLALIARESSRPSSVLEQLRSHYAPVEPVEPVSADLVGKDPFIPESWNHAEGRLEEWESGLRELQSLPEMIHGYIEKERAALWRQARAEFAGFKHALLRQGVERLVVIAHGYSSTVREIAERIIDEEGQGDDFVVTVFVTRVGADDQFQARSLTNELRHAHVRGLSGSSTSGMWAMPITTTDRTGAIGLIDDRTGVLFLSSAELVDAGGLLLEQREVSGNLLVQFMKLAGRFKGSRCARALVLAESFKCVDSLHSEARSFDFHLPRVQVVQPFWTKNKLVRVVRARESVITWKAVKAARKAGRRTRAQPSPAARSSRMRS